MNERKIIFSGLDNAGKTSILFIFNKLYYFEYILHEMRPTLHIKYYRINYMETELNLWDMGGQKSYRRDYLNRKQFYFNPVDAVVYVIDTQDAARVDLALEYLREIIQVWQVSEQDLPLFFALHKSDPFLKFDKTHNQRITEIKARACEVLEDWTGSIQFVETSIFDLPSITALTGAVFSTWIPEYVQFHDVLKKHSTQPNMLATLLLGNRGEVIAEVYKHGLAQEFVHVIFNEIREIIGEIAAGGVSEGNMGLYDHRREEPVVVHVEKFLARDTEYFLVRLLLEEFDLPIEVEQKLLIQDLQRLYESI